MGTVNSGVPNCKAATSGTEERDLPGPADQLLLLADFDWRQSEEVNQTARSKLFAQPVPALLLERKPWHGGMGYRRDGHSSSRQPGKPAAWATD